MGDEPYGASEAVGNRPSWEVVRTEDITIFIGGKGAERGKRVHVRTATGDEFAVEVPLSAFSEQNVRSLIVHQYTVIQQVRALSGEPLF